MEELNISRRLEYIASRVPKGLTVADIGTDHGYLPIYLAMHEISPKVVAMDVRKGPLKKAEENVQLYGVKSQVELRLSNGLEALEKGEAKVITISGMGGPLIQSILLNGISKLTPDTRLILSPQSELREFRQFLREKGFIKCKEHMLEEEGQFYVIMECVYLGEQYSSEVMSETYDRYGKELLLEKNQSLQLYLEREQRINNGLLEKMSRLAGSEDTIKQRIEELMFDKACIDFALEHYSI